MQSSKKAPIIDRGGITGVGDDSMLHNEARELLVEGYEATHDAEGIAKAYSVSKVMPIRFWFLLIL